MSDLVALLAPAGTDEANHGTVRYRVDSDGLMRVPPEAVFFLISTGGFAVAKTTPGPIPASQPDEAPLGGGMVRLHHEDAAGCSYGGREYSGDEKGDVLVPAEAASDLLAHGFVPAVSAPGPSKGLPSARLPKG